MSGVSIALVTSDVSTALVPAFAPVPENADEHKLWRHFWAWLLLPSNLLVPLRVLKSERCLYRGSDLMLFHVKHIKEYPRHSTNQLSPPTIFLLFPTPGVRTVSGSQAARG